MDAGFRRATRVLDAAVACFKIEAQEDVNGVTVGATAAKRELSSAVADYLRFHGHDLRDGRRGLDSEEPVVLH